MRVARITCAASIDADSSDVLPTELLVFAAGVNRSSKGSFTFDAVAAAAVMRAYTESGTDIMIDREHDSLDETARAMRADAGDAMGWGKLELRDDGSLWLTGVKWGTEGEMRLRQKRQRYLSPAFTFDEAGRPAQLINVALVARPALCDARPLVAASRVSATYYAAARVSPRTRAIAYEALEILKHGSRKG